MYKILICDPIADSAVQILKDAPDVIYDSAYGSDSAELKKRIGNYNAVIVRSATTLNKSILKNAEILKAIGRAGSGLDNIDTEFAKQKGIQVFNTPGTNAPAVAEMTIGLLFALARNINRADQSMKNGRWAKKDFVGIELNDKKLGIIGCGTIGKIVARKAAMLDMKLLIHNRSDVNLNGVLFEQVSIDKLLQESDFITIHLPKSDETKSIIGEAELDKMKTGVYLINTSRGGMIVEEKLLQALDDGKIAGGALDVFENEPNFNKKIAEHPKIITTPHIAASTIESQERVGVQIVDQILEFLRSKYIFL